MKRQLAVAIAMSLAVLLAVPALAAPKLQLPDADMFCGAGLAHEVDGFVGNPNGGSLWITDATYGGHYVVVTSDHYLAPGVLLSAPQEDLGGFIPLGVRYFGAKKGTTDRLECYVVSRWDFPGNEGDFTVLAPVELARVS